MDVNIRWILVKRDVPALMRVESESFDDVWTEKQWRCSLLDPDTAGMVAEHKGAVIGYMVYQFGKGELRLLSFAVEPRYRRRGIGRELAEKLKMKLNQHKRKSISLSVRESNLDAQCFFRELGFKATKVCRAFYSDTGEDAYRFVYSCEAAVPQGV